jgi:hypothetical protein
LASFFISIDKPIILPVKLFSDINTVFYPKTHLEAKHQTNHVVRYDTVADEVSYHDRIIRGQLVLQRLKSAKLKALVESEKIENCGQ